MPKEYLFPEVSSHKTRELAKIGAGSQPRAIKVIWNKMGYVQIATVVRAAQASGETPRTEDEQVDDGQHLELSRSDLNQLIRTVRRARDQAFGRDE